MGVRGLPVLSPLVTPEPGTYNLVGEKVGNGHGGVGTMINVRPDIQEQESSLTSEFWSDLD